MFFSTLYQSFELTLNIVIFGLPYSTKVTCFASLIFSLDCAKVQPRFSELVSTSQRSGWLADLFVFHTPNLTTTADANEFTSFPTSNSHYSDYWSCAGVGSGTSWTTIDGLRSEKNFNYISYLLKMHEKTKNRFATFTFSPKFSAKNWKKLGKTLDFHS